MKRILMQGPKLMLKIRQVRTVAQLDQTVSGYFMFKIDIDK